MHEGRRLLAREPAAGDAANWFSVHLDLTSEGLTAGDLYGPAGDRVAHEVVTPLIERLRLEGRVERWFFIRFLDPVPHLRLRFLAPAREHPRLDADVREACATYGSSGTSGTLRPRLVPYEPELARYGDKAGIELSERLFEASSRLVLELLPVLRKGSGDPSLRFGHGVMGALVLTGGLLGPDGRASACNFLSVYADATVQRRTLPERRNRLHDELQALAARQDALCDAVAPIFDGARTPESLPEPLQAAAHAFIGVRRGLTQAWQAGTLDVWGTPTASRSHALGRLAGSYLHMHLNRLGVLPRHEPLVCRIAARALERQEMLT